MVNGEADKKKDDIFAYRTREELLGVERTVVVIYEQELYHRNLKTFGFVGHKYLTEHV